MTSPSSVAVAGAGQRRADLPGHQQQRQVPRADHADHAARHAHRVVQREAVVGGFHVEAFARHVADQVGEDLEVGGAARDVHVAGQHVRLAGVGHLGRQEVVEAAVDAVGDGMQHFHALLDLHRRPRAGQRRPGRTHGGIDLGLAGFVHRADQAVVDGIAVLEGLAGGDPLAIDEILEFVHGHTFR